jgi:hypothetical protein
MSLHTSDNEKRRDFAVEILVSKLKIKIQLFSNDDVANCVTAAADDDLELFSKTFTT